MHRRPKVTPNRTFLQTEGFPPTKCNFLTSTLPSAAPRSSLKGILGCSGRGMQESHTLMVATLPFVDASHNMTDFS